MKEIQAIIRQITASVTFLPLLDEPCAPLTLPSRPPSLDSHGLAALQIEIALDLHVLPFPPIPCVSLPPAQAPSIFWFIPTRTRRPRPTGKRATRGTSTTQRL